MARSLTVYILHCGNNTLHDVKKCAENLSQSDIDFRVEIVPSGISFVNLTCSTHWKLFLYSDERLSVDLLKALPVYIAQDQYNVLSMYRITEDEMKKDKTKDDIIISICPRLFYGNVSLKNWSLEPVNRDDIKWSTILDGFIIGKI